MKDLVAKFGGSSLKDLTALKRCVGIVHSNPRTKIVVLSAIKGVTNKLDDIAADVINSRMPQAIQKMNDLHNFHLDYTSSLRSVFIQESLNCLFLEAKQIVRSFERFNNPLAFTDSLLAIGERASSLIFYFILEELSDNKISYLDARSIIQTDDQFSAAIPNVSLVARNMESLLSTQRTDYIYITQGFIGSNPAKQTTTLGRDGSDYSAALFAEALKATVLQIWTDVPGLASSDPRFVEETKIIHEINYQKAELLSNLGANILHPKTLAPAKRKDIAVFIGSSKEPELSGTWIRKETTKTIPIAGVTQKKNYTRARVSFSSLDENKVRELINNTKTFSLRSSIKDNEASLVFAENIESSNLLNQLKEIATVDIVQGYENLSIIGDGIGKNENVIKTIEHLQKSNDLDLFDQGEEHLSFLVATKNGTHLMNTLHQQIFANSGSY